MTYRHRDMESGFDDARRVAEAEAAADRRDDVTFAEKVRSERWKQLSADTYRFVGPRFDYPTLIIHLTNMLQRAVREWEQEIREEKMRIG